MGNGPRVNGRKYLVIIFRDGSKYLGKDMIESSGTSESRRLLDVIYQSYSSVAWTHKIHEKEREIWSGKVRWFRRCNVLLIGSTSLSAVWGAVGSEPVVFILTSVLGAISTMFYIYQYGLGPDKTESEHRLVAKRLLDIRNQYWILIEGAISGAISSDEMRSKLKDLHRNAAIIYEYAPDTSPKAYDAAKEAIMISGELALDDRELDKIIPSSLRHMDRES